MRLQNTRFLVSVMTILLSGILILAVFFALSDVAGGQASQAMDIQLQAIQKAVRQCYALEGAYPPSLQYLADHYGLLLNDKDYRFRYEIFAGNIPPIVEVYPHE